MLRKGKGEKDGEMYTEQLRSRGFIEEEAAAESETEVEVWKKDWKKIWKG